jgi:hypothetical protein
MNQDQINILWIEDNPLQEGLFAAVINEREGEMLFDDSLTNTRVPAVYFNGERQEYFRYFKLQLLQHPEEIREYISSCLTIEDIKGAKELGATEGAVPELVIFDYKLYENIDLGSSENSMIYTEETKVIREHLNPNFNIYEKHRDLFGERTPYFENDEITSYSTDDFVKRINNNSALKAEDDTSKKDKSELLNDQLGLFAGVEIARMFRNHPCVAVPATFNNSDVAKMHVFSKFYEWMNEYDLGTMFSSKNRGEKRWDVIIPHAVEQLRVRIQTQIRSGRITPSYDQLNQLSKDGTSQDGFFSFISAYGKRRLPLNGLFIDEPASTRSEKIKSWAELSITLLSNSGAEIRKAIDVSNRLWEVFNRDFGRRIDLSNLAYWDRRPDCVLTPEEQNGFAKLKEEFGVKNGEIEVDTCSIQGLFPEKKQNKVDVTIRLTVLHLAARGAIEMNKCRKNASNKAIYNELDQYEYFNLLFPIVSLRNDVILPMHKEDDKDDLIQQGRKWAYRKLGTTEGDWLNFEKWITPGEKSLLRSIYFAQDEYYPDWLKQ